MIDLQRELSQTWRAASQLSPENGGGRAIMFMSAREDAGTSSVAASFAMLAAKRSKRAVWLVDLDLNRNSQFEAFDKGAFSKQLGRLGKPHKADLGEASFFSISSNNPDKPVVQTDADASYFCVHRAGQSNLLVSRFRNDILADDQKVKIKTGAEYWRAVRGVADWIVVDAPSLETSSAGLAVCSQMDASALVVRADKTTVNDAGVLANEVEGHGGVCLGVVMNDVRADARFADQFSMSA